LSRGDLSHVRDGRQLRFGRLRVSLEQTHVETTLSAAGAIAPRVARGSGLRASRLAGRVRSVRSRVVGSGPVGERVTPTPLRGQGPLPLGQDPRRIRSQGCTIVSYLRLLTGLQIPSGHFFSCM
jgi:hypothetical protein